MDEKLNKIILNIGGKKYETSTETLLKSQYFSDLIKSSKICQNIEYFIDRNGIIFEYILNWMRTNYCPLDYMTINVIYELLLESSFYKIQLEDEIKDFILKNNLCNINEFTLNEKKLQTLLKLKRHITPNLKFISLIEKQESGIYNNFKLFEFSNNKLLKILERPIKTLDDGFNFLYDQKTKILYFSFSNKFNKLNTKVVRSFDNDNSETLYLGKEIKNFINNKKYLE